MKCQFITSPSYITKTKKKLASEYLSIDNVYDECEECGRPVILHMTEECTRDVDEGLEVIAKNWRDLKKRLKPILKEIKEEREKEKEQNVYLDGIKQIGYTLQMQINTPDTKRDTSTPLTIPTPQNKPKLLTKPAKVPIWTKDITLETYTKLIQT